MNLDFLTPRRKAIFDYWFDKTGDQKAAMLKVIDSVISDLGHAS